MGGRYRWREGFKMNRLSKSLTVLVSLCLASFMTGCANLLVPVVIATTPMVLPPPEKRDSQNTSIGKSDIETVTTIPDGKLVFGSLPPQPLPEGQCGLFLWGAGEGRPLYFFQNTAETRAIIPVNGKNIIIQRSAADRQIVEGFFARQNFTVDDIKISVILQPDQGRNVLKGVVIPTGIINITENSGRQSVFSVVGLFSCKL